MAVRASDKVTLAVLSAVSYVRPYYLLQASNLAVPTKPTTNPPASPWTISEPDFTMGSTDTLYTTMLIGYGNAYFEYGDVQKSSSYEAAKQAYNQAVNAASQAGQALTSANGKNTNWYQNDPPAGTGHKLHDCWFDLNDSNRMYRWNGTAWTSTQFGNNAFSAIDAGKITTGSLAAARIAAKSLTVDKLLVGSGDELIPDPWFTALPLGTNVLAANNAEVPQTGIPTTATRVYKLTTRDTSPFGNGISSPVSPGTRFRFEAWVVAAATTTRNFSHYIYKQTDSIGGGASAVAGGGSTPPSTTWQKVAWEYTVPDTGTTWNGFPFGRPFLQVNTQTGDTADKWVWYVTGWSVKRMIPGELIVDGSILARHVEMDTAFADKFWANEGNFGKINTNMVSSTFGSELNILSNEGITFMAGELATQSATISDLELVANDALSTAQTAETDVATALATAETANGAALLAKASADGANDRITEHQSVFKITPTGAVISTVNAEQELRLNPSSIELAQNGIAISRWEAGRFIVNETIMNKAQIAEHSFEVYSPKRTIIRPI